jgi:hypothetical protein
MRGHVRPKRAVTIPKWPVTMGRNTQLNKEVYKTAPKILIRQTADRIIAAIDYKGIWFGRSIIAMLLKPNSAYAPEYFLGILNSKYFEYHYDTLTAESGRVFAQVKLAKVNQLPIRIINFSDSSDRTAHDRMTILVKKMLSDHERRSEAKTPHAKTVLERQIASHETEIDKLVYMLYGLTEVDIANVESRS